MPSVVHGPGKQEGMAADLPPRPSSLWECLADKVEGMDVHQVRRVMMLILRVTIGVRLEDIGRAFDLHKGHVSREIDRATTDLLELLQESGIESPIQRPPDADNVDAKEKRTFWIFPEEYSAMKREAAKSGISASSQARIWLLAGGLSCALRRSVEKPDDAE